MNFMRLKLRRTWIISVLMVLCCASSMQAYQGNLSFDSLFSKTWYQKGLEASMYVWQSLMNVFENNSDGAMLSLDVLLGRLAFAQFCINRMHQEDRSYLADDKVYFFSVLQKVKQLLALVIITPRTHDFIVCAEDIIEGMEKKLGITYSN